MDASACLTGSVSTTPEVPQEEMQLRFGTSGNGLLRAHRDAEIPNFFVGTPSPRDMALITPPARKEANHA